MLQKALAASGDVDMHHEYMVQILQPLAIRRFMGWADAAETRAALRATYGAAIAYCDARHWGDSSNKAAWLISDIAALLPEAKFVHLVRDGRKVASSYFHKLGAECYEPRAQDRLQAFADAPDCAVAPPPEKKYWWPLARPGDPFADEFRGFDQFQRIVWHWSQINRVILEACARLPSATCHFVRLEDLYNSADAVRSLFDFLGVAFRAEIAGQFARPHNVNRPEDRLLDARQRAQFDAIAAPMMTQLGYEGKPEYLVNY